MNRRLITFFLSLFFFHFFLASTYFANNTSLPQITTPNLAPSSNYLEVQFIKPAKQNAVDFGFYLASPFQWNLDQWMTAGVVAGVTGMLIWVDKPIFDYFDKNHLKEVNNATDVFFKLGDKYVILYSLSGLFASGLVLQDVKLQHASYLAIKSFGFQIITTQFFKDLFLRRINGNPYQFEGPKWNFPSDEGALPSGHAGFVWAVLTSYAEEYREDQPWVTTLCYTSATLSSLTLVTRQSHWISDIFMGAAIGYYTALSVRNMDKNNPGFTVYPMFIGSGYGVGVGTTF